MRPSALLPLLLSTAQACIHATIHWDINGYQFALTDNDTTRCTSTAGTTDAPLTNPGTKGATFAIPSGDCQAGYSAKIWMRLGENYAAKLEQYTDIEGVHYTVQWNGSDKLATHVSRSVQLIPEGIAFVNALLLRFLNP
ncbi:hypothetical protein EYC84_003849 [Monilinia fructicola]|uniref:Uncharacterized protein n=1 Tax=Monilinia fructicola TaxID=38448 RepID=A0A5M9JV32_MONFR|nr:hypothetical protein EYC84_003849 [Monilinia fructicola]